MTSQNPRLLRHAQRSFQALTRNFAHLHAARYALSIYKSDAIYSFIPKNACSTMRYTIAIANGAIIGSRDFNWIHENNSTFQASLSELIKAKYTFTILRDPYRRIGSCYLDKMVDQTAVAWQYHALTNYRTMPAMLTFREFILNLKSRLGQNEHWRPQIDFLVYEEYDDFYCLEEFPDAIATLRQRIGLEVQDARNLTRHGTDQFQPLEGDEPFADRPAYEIAELKRTGKIPRVEQLYDPSLAAEVRQMYADDIAFYAKKISRPCLFPTV